MTSIQNANINIAFAEDGDIVAKMSVRISSDILFECTSRGKDFDKVVYSLSNQISEKVSNYLMEQKKVYSDVDDLLVNCQKDEALRNYLVEKISKWDKTETPVFDVANKPTPSSSKKESKKTTSKEKSQTKTNTDTDLFWNSFFSL